MSKEKGQGMTEYAVILALIVGIALAVYNSGSLQNTISGVFNSITATIEGNSEENDRQAADMNNAKQLAKILKDAMANGTVTFDGKKAADDDWLELSVQNGPNGTTLFNGGANNESEPKETRTHGVAVNGQNYGTNRSLWNGVVNGQMDYHALSVQQKSNQWYGVRVYGNGTTEYYAGSKFTEKNAPDFDNTKPVPLN